MSNLNVVNNKLFVFTSKVICHKKEWAQTFILIILVNQ